MKNKLTQNEKIMIETQRKILEAFEKNGLAENLRSQSKIAAELIKKAQVPKITPIGNIRPTDKRIRKAEELLYEYTFTNQNADVEDILKALEIIGDSRVKAKTKWAIADGSGESYDYRQKCLKVYNKYLQLQAQGKSKPRAKNIISGMSKFNNPKPTTLKKWLITGKKESKK